MVGTFGSENQRFSLVTASARNWPSWISVSAAASATDPTMTVFSSTACAAGPAPRYGTCTISMSARSLSNSPVRCDFVPAPGLE